MIYSSEQLRAAAVYDLVERARLGPAYKPYSSARFVLELYGYDVDRVDLRSQDRQIAIQQWEAGIFGDARTDAERAEAVGCKDEYLAAIEGSAFSGTN